MLFRRLLDFIAPRACVVCGRRLPPDTEVLCASCQLRLPRTGFQLSPKDNVMARLFWGIIPVENVAALCYYAPGSEVAQLVYDMKYHDRPDIGEALGRMMASEFMASGFFDGIDCLVPLPLARKRERQRGYNQSRQLAIGVSEVSGVPVSDDMVCRTAFAKSQTQLGRRERQENVENVFQLREGSDFRGRHVLLIDDIVTTGATVVACARELLKVEGVRISILAFGLTRN
jgi:ComF family protein